MPFVKVLKSNTYCSRYQTKYRRRREGKTDYQARKRLCFQDKNKYDTKKYRLCVRRTNRKIICQIIFATIGGDKVMCAADSKELSRYGATAGLTSYSAAYATGLLCARRHLKNIKFDIKGNEKVDGSLYHVECDERRPFQANLDVGLVRTTTGNRVFGAMKGASDGGLLVPHNEKRFPGFKVIKAEVQTNKRGKKTEEQAEKKTEFSAKEHKDHIFGAHVQKYFDDLKKADQNRWKKQFSQWIKCLETSKVKDIPALWARVHADIRKNPDRVVSKNAKPTRKVVSKAGAPELIQQDSKGRKWLRQKRTEQSKKQRLAKIAGIVKKVQARFGKK